MSKVAECYCDIFDELKEAYDNSARFVRGSKVDTKAEKRLAEKYGQIVEKLQKISGGPLEAVEKAASQITNHLDDYEFTLNKTRVHCYMAKFDLWDFYHEYVKHGY
jgi:hypothetical protein